MDLISQVCKIEMYLSALDLAEAAVEEGKKCWFKGVRFGYLMASKQVGLSVAPSRNPSPSLHAAMVIVLVNTRFKAGESQQ